MKHGKDTLSSLHYQANSAFPQRIDEIIAEDDLVRLVNGLIDQLDYKFPQIVQGGRLESFPSSYDAQGSDLRLHDNIYSCRKIEERILRDVHFIWLAGYEKPDFATINRFHNRMKKEINAVFTQVVLLLTERGFISLDVEHIDVTKIESKANKYTFVWRKTVEKNRARLLEKIRVLQQNLYYNKELDYFVCPMGQHMEVSALRILRPKAATGYSRVSTRQKTAI